MLPTSPGWTMILLTPFPAFRWTGSAPWFPQRLPLPAPSLYQRYSSDSLSTAILPRLSRPIHKASLSGRSKALCNLQPHARTGGPRQSPTVSFGTDPHLYFASHLAKTVSYDTVKLYLVAVQDLHRELNLHLHTPKIHRTQKVLMDIKRLTPSKRRDRLPITIQVLTAIHDYLRPELSTNSNHIMLWAASPWPSSPCYTPASSAVSAPSIPRCT